MEGAGKVSNWIRTPGAVKAVGFDYSALRQDTLV